MPPDCTFYQVLPLQKEEKHEIQDTSALEETRKEAEG